jgi:serine/threonine protein kinase
VYSLLAGRSPFEVPGKDNSPGHLAGRILKSKPQPIGRSDVPARLEEILNQAMSKNPIDRPHSAVEFARQLQQVETSLGLAQTPLDVVGDEWGSTAIVINENDRTALSPLDSHSSPAWKRQGYNSTPAERDELALVAAQRRRKLFITVATGVVAVIAIVTLVLAVVAG